MAGCALLVLLALAMLVAGGPTATGDLPLGFLVGIVAGALFSLLGIYNAGWNAHVEHVRQRDYAKAERVAEEDRK